MSTKMSEQYMPAQRGFAISQTNEFRKKELYTKSLDIGLVCDHGCRDCRTLTFASARTHEAFGATDTTAQKAYGLICWREGGSLVLG